MADATKHKARVPQLDLIGELLQAKVQKILFVKFDSRYTYYFPEYSKYFVKVLRLLKSVYDMTNYVKLYADELR